MGYVSSSHTFSVLTTTVGRVGEPADMAGVGELRMFDLKDIVCLFLQRCS